MALLLAGSGCAGPRPAPAAAGHEGERPPPRILVLPLENLSGGAAPLRDLAVAVEVAVASRGIEVITGDLLESFLAKYRIRYTGGLDRAAAKAARDDLGADGVLVTTLETYAESPPRIALAMRLVSTGGDPAVAWIDGYGRTGDDRPGWLNLGLVGDVETLRNEGLNRLGASLADFLAGKTQGAPPCVRGGWWRPRVAFRAQGDGEPVQSILVLPFVNATNRRGAGEVAALEFVRQLTNSGGFRVFEPGIVRDLLLRFRIVMEGGVSVDQARSMLNSLEADYVVAGTVFALAEGTFSAEVSFSALVIDRRTGRIVWDSSSFNKATDSMTLFGLNGVSTAQGLACRMIRNVVEGMAGRQSLPPKP